MKLCFLTGSRSNSFGGVYTELFTGSVSFIIAAPIAYFASLYGGLILAPWLSATLLGSLPVLTFVITGVKSPQNTSPK
ncbi:hypothetical protein [Endozoicomonas atrinae]|uniref:hypothetical protein n=1 Tax=Endozoicomonas atrinae TaxID=1333660 RepID=UPI000B24EF2D|nr:hypothetical protein [Endozoicomonas atrinae]